jgi:hypothetical protein
MLLARSAGSYGSNPQDLGNRRNNMAKHTKQSLAALELAGNLRERVGQLEKQRDDLLAACIDVESKIVDYAQDKINWRPDDFLFRVREAIANVRK